MKRDLHRVLPSKIKAVVRFLQAASQDGKRPPRCSTPQWLLSACTGHSLILCLIWHVEDGVMQMRPKTYLHFISWWRSLRETISPHNGDVPANASPILIYAAVVLAFFLAILEIDAHRGKLESLALLGNDYPIPAAFSGP